MSEQYNLKQIKAAFWARFRGAGEIFFPYKGMGASEEEIEGAIQSVWDDFLEELEVISDSQDTGKDSKVFYGDDR